MTHDDPDRRDEERLAAYLDDAMSPEEAREFLAWLESHPDALREAEEHRRVWSLLGTYRDEPVPEGFAERVIARTGARAQAPVLRLAEGVRRWRRLAVAAAVLAAAGLGVAAFQWRRATVSPVEPAGTLAALEVLPESLLDDDAIDRLADLSDEEFEALLVADPQELTPDAPRPANRGG
jgi:anti-sigma factor RsiW